MRVRGDGWDGVGSGRGGTGGAKKVLPPPCLYTTTRWAGLAAAVASAFIVVVFGSEVSFDFDMTRESGRDPTRRQRRRRPRRL